jgi:hypothetical protein
MRLTTAVAILCLGGTALHAQQWVTDDADITEYRACAFQMWHGQRSTWMEPTCTPIRDVELSLGFVAVWEDGGAGHFEYEMQGKTRLRPLRTNSWGAALVVGTGRAPSFTGIEKQAYSMFSYVPISVSLWSDRVVLHENTGWLYEHRPDEGGNAITWAARADIRYRKFVAFIAEAYGAKGVGTNAPDTPAEFQTGFRVWLRPERVEVDLSYGALTSGQRGQGWTLGLTLTTPPFL